MPQTLTPIQWNYERPQVAPATQWIWPGLLAAGNLTLLTSVWKAGKTTLVSLLLDRRREGGLLLNREVAAGGTIVVSEEDAGLWERRQHHLDFGPQVGFLCRPYDGRATPERWLALLDQLRAARAERGIDLVVIDPLSMFLPGDENHARTLLGPLHDLQSLTCTGMAVLLLHHPSKEDRAPGRAARGSGALSACADILLEMYIPSGDPGTRRRKLLGFSRHPETPEKLVIELDKYGADYAVFGDTKDDDLFRLALKELWRLLAAAGQPLTRQEIHDAWPAELPKPSDPTLWRWLTRAVSLDMLARYGAGTKAEAFRYGICESQ
jgi:AAA domain